jgi:hypothetical protein
MSLIPQILALFNVEPPIGLIFEICDHAPNRIEFIIKYYKYSVLSIQIVQTEKIIVMYALADEFDYDYLFTFELTDISLDNIINPLFNKQNIIDFISDELQMKIDNIHILSLLFYFEENCVKIYKSVKTFPDIYYKSLKYDNLDDILKIIEYKVLSHSALNMHKILELILDPCDNPIPIIKAVTN